jgi:hypothetical protein
MTDSKSGFIVIFKNDEIFHKVMSYHCVMHLELLCANFFPFKHLLDRVTEKSQLEQSHCKTHFKKSLDVVEAEYSDLICTEVRWLNKGKVLEGSEFKNEVVDSLNEYQWVTYLAFRADVTQKFCVLNLQLQGMDQPVADMISTVNMFKNKLLLWKSHIDKKNR